jgi:rare lipoprotein A (peptidoglycan hydrolase)
MFSALVNYIDPDIAFSTESNIWGISAQEHNLLKNSKKTLFTALCLAVFLLFECSLSPRYTRPSNKKAPYGVAAKKAVTRFNGTANTTYQKIGLASYYSSKFEGRKTANGEIFSNSHLTAAHLTLPFGTKVKVTCLANGRSVIVRINDRGPFKSKKRIIDLSQRAARELGIIKKGVAKVRIEVVE